MPRTVPTPSSARAPRRLAATTATLALALSSGLVLTGPAAGAGPERRPSDDVNVFVGSMAGQPDFGTGGGAGNTYPGAQRPFGMLAWSPDTYPSTDNYASGYTYTDTRIRGFSLTHLSGPGCAVFGDVPILPTTQPVTSSPVSPGSAAIDPKYLADFEHEHESAHPGAYEVTLNPGTGSPIEVALAADTRSGVGSFTFPATQDAGFLVNVGGSLMAASAADVQIDPQRRLVTGSVTSGRFCFSDTSYRLYFALRFSEDLASYGTWQRQVFTDGGTSASDVSAVDLNYTPFPGGPGQLPGDPSGTAQAGAYVGFDATDGDPVRVQVGISYVDPRGARANLRHEQQGFDVPAAQEEARAAWDAALGRVTVEGGTATRRRVFTTALYRSLQTPSVFSDVDGRYIGTDGAIHRSRRTHYANFSGWDVYRTQLPLVAMLFPGIASDIAQSLVDQGSQAGWLPKWSYANANTQVMAGDPALPSLAAMRAFGAGRFDLAEAVRLGHKDATDPSQYANLGTGYVVRPGMGGALALGYVPAEDDVHSPIPAMFVPGTVWGSAATTLEYAVADHALAVMARAAGDREVARAARQRATWWRNLYNPATGYLEPRSATGQFEPGYDPAGGDGFVEGNAAQYTWFVPHDVPGLVATLGGPEAAAERLDDFFGELNAGPAAPYAFLGNEPSLGVPWLYAWLGRPNAIPDLLRRTAAGLYKDEPGGLPGNDDLGTMSAWYVLASLGLYPAVPGSDTLVLTSPMFPRITLRLPGGTVRLRAPNTRRAPYVAGVRLDGRAVTGPWVRFARLEDGATLRYRTTTDPNPRWGTDVADAPRP